ncbi:MAG: S1 RNA-binding domain-containing protein [Lachnospiraceae bacterium]|nr:S1 RNA-binding domain-containing protein [Lachnospiraceae bacterium]
MADEIKSEALSENEAGQTAAASPQTVSVNADAPQASEPQTDEHQAVSKESGTQTPGAQADEPQTMADVEAELNASFRPIREGDTLDCEVVGVDDDKVTVDIASYTDGIIRKEDVSDDPSYSIREHISVGQKLQATVIRRDDHGHVGLSLKKAASLAAWDRARNLLASKENVRVKISGVTKAGAIAYLDGIRAFIPASKLSLGYVSDDELPGWIGKEIEVRVITADEGGNHLVLSAKDILHEKREEERRAHIALVKPGTITEGTVESLKDFGAFVDIGEGVTGLLHVSQISQKRIKSPADVLKVGQKVRVKITKVADGRVSLSMKALEDEGDPQADTKEEHYDLPKSEEIGTGLGALLKNIRL